MWSPEEIAAAASAASGGRVEATVDGLVGTMLGGLTAVRDDVAVLALRSAPNGARSAP